MRLPLEHISGRNKALGDIAGEFNAYLTVARVYGHRTRGEHVRPIVLVIDGNNNIALIRIGRKLYGSGIAVDGQVGNFVSAGGLISFLRHLF